MSSRTNRVKKKLERDRKQAASRRGSNKRRAAEASVRRQNRGRDPIDAIPLGDRVRCSRCSRVLNNPAAGLVDVGISDGTNVATATCPCGQRLRVQF